MADLKEAQIGAALRRLREQRKMSLEALGKRTGVNHSYIGQLERGEIGSPRLVRVFDLCEGLGITVNDLLIEAGLMKRSAGYRPPPDMQERLAEAFERNTAVLERLEKKLSK